MPDIPELDIRLFSFTKTGRRINYRRFVFASAIPVQALLLLAHEVYF
jgi:hypothetical protein